MVKVMYYSGTRASLAPVLSTACCIYCTNLDTSLFLLTSGAPVSSLHQYPAGAASTMLRYYTVVPLLTGLMGTVTALLARYSHGTLFAAAVRGGGGARLQQHGLDNIYTLLQNLPRVQHSTAAAAAGQPRGNFESFQSCEDWWRTIRSTHSHKMIR